jgi:DnaJ-class molecular chaperone
MDSNPARYYYDPATHGESTTQEEPPAIPCPQCAGHGCTAMPVDMTEPEWTECPRCDGAGTVLGDKKFGCNECDGTGEKPAAPSGFEFEGTHRLKGSRKPTIMDY